jgi:hypothetical protein
VPPPATVLVAYIDYNGDGKTPRCGAFDAVGTRIVESASDRGAGV